MSHSINVDRDRKYPVDPADPIGTRAHDELMRVTGMGEYAERMSGGPPGQVRASIPAQEEYDTDCIIGAALRNRQYLRAAVRLLLKIRDENALGTMTTPLGLSLAEVLSHLEKGLAGERGPVRIGA